MNETTYLLLLSRKGKSLQALKETFRELGGFYANIGYAFPKKSASFLREIAESINEKIYEMPLSEGETFESLKHGHKASFFMKRLCETELELLKYKKELKVEEISEEIVRSSNAHDERKEKILDVLYEHERIKDALSHSERVEKILSEKSNVHFEIKFINERTTNFLLEEAPEMPRLINFIDDKERSRPFIKKGCTGMVVGAGGSGKTHWLTQLSLSIVTGYPFLEKYPIEKSGYVFLGLGENSEEDIHRLLRKILKGVFHIANNSSCKEGQHLKDISKKLAVTSFIGIPSSFIHRGTHTATYQRFINELKAREPDEGWSCIILDPISRFLGSDAENDNASATAFIELLERLTMELKGRPTVLFGHHMNKSGIMGTSTDQAVARGSSAITDGVRLQINLEKTFKDGVHEKEKINMRMVKSNFTSIIPDQILKKDSNGCLHIESAESHQEVKF